MQADDYDSVRPGLIAMLPRLMRFSDTLAGVRGEGRALLRRALRRMLSEQHHYQRGSALDVWAFRELYRQWLRERGHRIDPVTQSNVDDEDFAELFRGDDGSYVDTPTVSFLGALPPPQRLTLLLVYGEGFEHEDAAQILDVSADIITGRLVRMSAALADRLSGRMAAEAAANVANIHSEDMRASP